MLPSPPESAPIPVVCAIIERDGLILLAQRPPGKALAGLWEFPGGKVEPNESPADALHRELAEELHCTVTILQSGPPVTHAYDWGSIELHPYLCHLTPTSPAPTPQEHTALTWVLPKHLLTHPLAPADVPIVHWLRSILSID